MPTLAQRTAALASRDPRLRGALLETLRLSKAKRARLDTNTLNRLVEMVAGSMGYNTSATHATADVVRAAKKFGKAVSKTLSLWSQRNPPKDDATVSDLMRAGAIYDVFMTLESGSVGIGDGRWAHFYEDTRKLEKFLQRSLDQDHTRLRQALEQAARETSRSL